MCSGTTSTYFSAWQMSFTVMVVLRPSRQKSFALWTGRHADSPKAVSRNGLSYHSGGVSALPSGEVQDEDARRSC